MLFPKPFDLSRAVTLLTLKKYQYMSEDWYVRAIEIKFASTNRTENSSRGWVKVSTLTFLIARLARNDPRNSFVVRSWTFCHSLKFEPFLVISSCIHLKTSLDMLKNRIKSYHSIMGKFKQVCRIVSNRVVIFVF